VFYFNDMEGKPTNENPNLEEILRAREQRLLLESERTIVHETPYPNLWTLELLKQIADQAEEIKKEKWGTPMFELDLKKQGCGKVLIKDESVNPTGTHKDRLAYAIAEQIAGTAKMLHRLYTEESPEMWGHDKDLPSRNSIERYSMITSGNAGMALAKTFNKFRLPPPKLLLDKTTSPEIINELLKENADVYLCNLGNQELNADDIHTLTNSNFGRDLTSETRDDRGLWQIYYIKLAEEIFKESPDNVFVPYGSGNLYEGLVSDQRVFNRGPAKANILGAEPMDPKTKAVMLSASAKPFKFFVQENMDDFRKYNLTGPFTDVNKLPEKFIEEAYHVYQEHGVRAGYSSAAGLGLYLARYRKSPQLTEGKTVVVNTGRGLVKKDWGEFK
jgi:cysteine synthase